MARFCSKYLPGELQAEAQFQAGDYSSSLVTVFHRMDERMRSPEGFAELEALRKMDSIGGERGGGCWVSGVLAGG